MLIEFSVENFRSIGEEQTLYLQPSSTKKDEYYLIETEDYTEPFLLPCIAIFGPNASGKSTVLDSLNFFNNFIQNSVNNKKDTLLPDVRFKLSPLWRDANTRFVIKFCTLDALYTYEIIFSPEIIKKERLTCKNKKKRARTITLIDRNENEIILHKGIYPEKPQFLDLWKVDVNNKQTLLSYLANKGGVTIFDPIMNWFKKVNFLSKNLPDVITSKMIFDKKINEHDLRNLLKSADLHFEDIKVSAKERALPDGLRNHVLREISKETGDTSEKLDINFQHTNQHFEIESVHLDTSGDPIHFNFKLEESEGTQTLYALAGPIIDTLQSGQILVIDELERSLHPYLLRKIVQLFVSKKTNPKGAQLIFTTHDVTVMDKTLLRPDEIFFTEKDKESFQTSLFCLTDFDEIGNIVKNDRGTKLYKDYLEGRFEAVPAIDW